MDYEKLKVTELKALLKERDIPVTGLTKKAQYIAALVEADATKNSPAGDVEGTQAVAHVEDTTTTTSAPQQEVEHDEQQDAATATEPEEPEPAIDVSESKVQQEETEADDTLKNESQTVAATAQTDSAPVQSDAVIGSRATPAAEAVIERPAEESNGQALPSSPGDRKRKRDVSPTVEQDLEASAKKAKVAESQPRTDAAVEPEPMDTSDTRNGQHTVSGSSANDQSSSLPSQYRPTTALYVKNLMRPLQAPAFQSELAALSEQRFGEQEPVVDLHLDGLKTHAFVVCRSVDIASDLRSAIHGKPWPQNETQRKAVWVDYVPEDKVSAWIEQEQRAARDSRFEVTYGHDQDGEPTAELTELSQRPQASQPPPPPQSRPAAGAGVPGAPLGPRGQRSPRQPPHEPAPPKQQSASFNKLDQYFKFTTTRPKIYFQPVDKELADRRLDEIDRETARDWKGGKSWNRSTRLAPIDQLRRYTFDDGDRIVDGGVDFGGFGRRQGAGGSAGFQPGAGRGGYGGRGRSYRP